MKIEVIPFADAVTESTISGKTVVVIDVLRATSVMVTALKNGAKEILPVLTIVEARSLAKQTNNFLLCGERDAQKIEGFHLGNSPLEYTKEIVNRKSIILTTTNGTRALNACKKANRILIGSFLNVNAVVSEVIKIDELVLVCSGTKGKYSMDDGMCAAVIINELSEKRELQLSDFDQTLLSAYQSEKSNIHALLKNCTHLQFLIKHGFENDVAYCLQKNTLPIVPEFHPDKGNVKITS